MPPSPNVHFISGLPRSGSTLLSALLSQNPALVTSGRSSPVAPMILRVSSLMAEGEYAADFHSGKRDRVLRQILDSYYASGAERRMIIDTHRDWCARLGLIDTIFPRAKVICCVRDPIWIMDSLERLIVRDPILSSHLVPIGKRATQHDRLDHLLSTDGVFGYAWRVLIEAFHGPFANRLIMLDYDYLARYPKATLDILTRELGLPAYEYDFEQVESHDHTAFDQALSTPGLHKLRPKVSFEERRCILPPSVQENLAGGMFWRRPEAAQNGVRILA